KAEGKVDLIRSGRSPIVERDIDELVASGMKSGRLSATQDAAAAVAATDISFICVGTPSRSNEALDLSGVGTVATEIVRAIRIKAEPHTIVLRSTVVRGTTRDVVAARVAEEAGNVTFSVAFNPEFLREGSAVADFNTPAKTVIGAFDDATAETVSSLYRNLP